MDYSRRFAFLSSLLAIFLSHCAHGAAFKNFSGLQSDWTLRALGKNKLVVSTPKNEMLLLSWGNLQNALRLEDSSDKLSDIQFSPDGNFLLASFVQSRRVAEMKVYDVLNGKVIQKSPKLERLQGAYWINSCRYAAITAPLENGGRLQVFKRPDLKKSKCPKDFVVSEKLPSDEMHRRVWRDSNFNTWAFYENGSRELLSWLGKGNFYDIQPGVYPYFWYRESATSELVFRADRKSKKIQPVAGASLYVADPSSDRYYGLQNGGLYLFSLDSKFRPREEALIQKLPEGFVAQALWLDASRKRLILRSEKGSYAQLKL